MDEEVLGSLGVEDKLEVKPDDTVNAERDEDVEAERNGEVTVAELDPDIDTEKLEAETSNDELGEEVEAGLAGVDNEVIDRKGDSGEGPENCGIVEKSTFGEKSMDEGEEEAGLDVSAGFGGTIAVETWFSTGVVVAVGPSIGWVGIEAMGITVMVVELVIGTIAFSVGDGIAFEDVFELGDKRVEMATLSSRFDAGIGDTSIVRVVFRVLTIPSMLGPVIEPGNNSMLFRMDRRTHTILGSSVATSFEDKAFTKPGSKKRLAQRSNILNNKKIRVDLDSQIRIGRWCLCRHDDTRRWNVRNPTPKHSRSQNAIDLPRGEYEIVLNI